MRQYLASLLLAAIAALALAGACWAGPRVALVIGNSTYRHVDELPGPADDAKAVAVALDADGFDVTVERDLNRDAMGVALTDFSVKARGAEAAIIYFAGHGLEIDGTNYMIPIDAQLPNRLSVGLQTVALDDMLAAVSPARDLAMVIVDACRNNPFRRSLVLSKGVSSRPGLAEPSGAGDILVFYAAGHGETARDEGFFADALVHRLAQPGLDVAAFLAGVTQDVLDTTHKEQRPHYYGSLGAKGPYLITLALQDRRPPAVAPTGGRLVVTPMGYGPPRPDFEGRAPVGVDTVWVAIRPPNSDECFVQGSTPVNSDQSWTYRRAYLGTAGDEGGMFEVRAFANPARTPEPGPTTCWPAAQYRSDAMMVRRR